MRVDFDTRKFANKINKNASVLVRKVALDGMRKLVRQSPVDTGRFKANWSTSVDKMHDRTTEEKSVNFNKQSKEIRDYDLGQIMFLHNNLEYALALEFGSSAQAGRGWIRAVAIEIQKKLDQIKNIIR